MPLIDLTEIPAARRRLRAAHLDCHRSCQLYKEPVGFWRSSVGEFPTTPFLPLLQERYNPLLWGQRRS